ncbi:MAG: hypothetical protein WKF60_12675 [Ilumatobacter sp.]
MDDPLLRVRELVEAFLRSGGAWSPARWPSSGPDATALPQM